MSDMKCPYCNKELESIIGACEDIEYYCQNCDYMTGDENLWNQLTKYKQALDVAVDVLKSIKTYYDDSYADPHFVNWHIVAQRLANDANDAIKEITALEQKEK